MGLILKRNFCVVVNGRFGTIWMVTLYYHSDYCWNGLNGWIDRDPIVVGAEVMESVVKRGKIAPLGIFIKTQTYTKRLIPGLKSSDHYFKLHMGARRRSVLCTKDIFLYILSTKHWYFAFQSYFCTAFIFSSLNNTWAPKNTDRHVIMKQPCVHSIVFTCSYICFFSKSSHYM